MEHNINGSEQLSLSMTTPSSQNPSAAVLHGSGWYEQQVFYATERDHHPNWVLPYGTTQMVQLRYGRATVRIPKLREPGQQMAYRIPFALKHSPGIQKNGRYSITLHNHHTGKPYLEDFNTALDPDHEKERDKAWPGVTSLVPDMFFCCCAAVPHQEGRCREPAQHSSARRQFLEQVKEAVKHSARRELVVFVHGYNVKFEAAIKSAAQLTFDSAQDYSTIDMPGRFQFKAQQRVAVAFDWASNASLPAYGFVPCVQDDRERAAEAGPKLAHLLLDLASKLKELEAEGTPCNGLHVVCHSMGNYVLHYAVEHLGNRPDCPGSESDPELAATNASGAAAAGAGAAAVAAAAAGEHPLYHLEAVREESSQTSGYSKRSCSQLNASAEVTAAAPTGDGKTEAEAVMAAAAAAAAAAAMAAAEDCTVQGVHVDQQQQLAQQQPQASLTSCPSSAPTGQGFSCSIDVAGTSILSPANSLKPWHRFLSPSMKSPFGYESFNRKLAAQPDLHLGDMEAAEAAAAAAAAWGGGIGASSACVAAKGPPPATTFGQHLKRYFRSFAVAESVPQLEMKGLMLRQVDSSQVILIHKRSLMRKAAAANLFALTKTIILAAADVSRHDLIKTVRQLKVGASMHGTLMPHITLYCSRRDQALFVSSFLRVLGFKRTDGRAGFFMRKLRWFEGHVFHPFLSNDVTSVDCTGFSADWLGHGYFKEHRQVLTDIAQIFDGHTNINHRTAIKAAKDGEAWKCERCNQTVLHNQTIELYSIMSVQEQHERQLQLVRKQLLKQHQRLQQLMECKDLTEWQHVQRQQLQRNLCYPGDQVKMMC